MSWCILQPRLPNPSILIITHEVNSLVQTSGMMGTSSPSAIAKETADEQRLSTLANVAIGVSVFIVNGLSPLSMNRLLLF